MVSYVKENKTWEGSGERLVEFWEYLSTQSFVDNLPHFKDYWDYLRKLDKRIASGESARRYFSTKEFIFKGVPKVFVPKIPVYDNRFLDPSNTWYIYDNKPLKDSLEKFAKFPISTSFENGEPRLLLVAIDVQEATRVVFDSYEKEDGTRKSEYGRYGRVKSDGSSKNSESKAFEHVIRYEDGIKSDFVLASCSVPVNYDYTKLNVENRVLIREGLDEEAVSVGNSQHTGSGSTSIRYFWDGGLLANTPLRQTILAHIDYWRRVRKLEYGIPRLGYGIINLHPVNKTIFQPTMMEL